MRTTRQRTAIRQTFEEVGRPLSPQEVLDAAQERVPNLGIATVYRNIRHLVDDGWLHPVELPGAPDRYEIAGKNHHHHFHCKSCDSVFDIHACPGGLQDLLPEGFKIESHEITLYGTCKNCAI